MVEPSAGIRKFYKTVRAVAFDTQGSIRLTSIEQAAYRSALTIEILGYRGQRYVGYKSLPEDTHWGYCTLFDGASVREKVAVKFSRQRLFEVVNTDVWLYYQHTELVNLLGVVMAKVGERTAELSSSESLPELFGRVTWQIVTEIGETALEILGYSGDVTPGALEPGEAEVQYKAFPIAPKMPSLVKFLGDLPCDFRFTLESWYLKNPVILITDNPIDTGDETDGENEYPQPQAGDVTGESEPDPNSDSRDFIPVGDENSPGGSQVRVTVRAYGNPEIPGGDPVTYTSVIVVSGDARGSVAVESTGQTGNTAALGSYFIGWRLRVYGNIVYTENVSYGTLPIAAVLYFKNGTPT